MAVVAASGALGDCCGHDCSDNAYDDAMPKSPPHAEPAPGNFLSWKLDCLFKIECDEMGFEGPSAYRLHFFHYPDYPRKNQQ